MWYSAHAVMLIRLTDCAQHEFPVWENIFLIEASDSDEATVKAQERALEDEVEGGGLSWEGHKAKCIFLGLRKLMQCFSDERQPGDGTELTHNQLLFSTQSSLDEFVLGRECQVTFQDENPDDD